MAAQTEAVAEIIGRRSQRNVLQRNWLLWKRRPLGMIGLALVAVLVLLAITAPLWQIFTASASGYDGVIPYKYASQISAQLVPPNADHWLGGDRYGRDLFTRESYSERRFLCT